jgi:hypothetical protein
MQPNCQQTICCLTYLIIGSGQLATPGVTRAALLLTGSKSQQGHTLLGRALLEVSNTPINHYKASNVGWAPETFVASRPTTHYIVCKATEAAVCKEKHSA